jgi:aspartate aminotransferase-like enzyme
MIHHRWPECAELYAQVRRGLQYILKTDNEIMILASSGTGAMDAAVANLHSPGERVMVIRGGNFGERWAKICQAYGLEVVPIDIPWGEAVDPGQVAAQLNKDETIRTVFATLCETSTGVTHDLKSLAGAVRPHSALLAVDAVSGLCAEQLDSDGWQVDVVTSATQKGLMCPPGISFLSLNGTAWDRVESASLPKFYWDFKLMRKFAKKNQTPYTPAISILYGLKAALDLIREEGIDNSVARHARLAKACRQAMQALNLELFAKSPANALTAVCVPQGMDGAELLHRTREVTGAVVAGGQAQLSGKIFRLAHMGNCDELDLMASIAALEKGLAVMGHTFEAGSGLMAAQKQLMP